MDKISKLGYFGHGAHINKPVYYVIVNYDYVYFSSFVNLLILYAIIDLILYQLE